LIIAEAAYDHSNSEYGPVDPVQAGGHYFGRLKIISRPETAERLTDARPFGKQGGLNAGIG
jgi:hypothetical protein